MGIPKHLPLSIGVNFTSTTAMAYTAPMNRLRALIASDIPFARDDAHRLLPAMIACLSGFAALLLLVAVSLSNALDVQSEQVIGTLQIELPRAKALDNAFMEQVQATVKRAEGVESVTVIGQQQMEILLKPWLGDDFALSDLPLPAMLDVRTQVESGRTRVDVEALQAALSKFDRAIRVEARGPWMSHLASAMTLLQGVVVLVALLLLICVTGMVVLVARTNLRLHFKAVSLLHMFGATDEYILRQFQWNNAWLAGRGAAMGVALAGAMFLITVLLSVRMESPVVPQLELSLLHWVTLLLLPPVTALVAMAATRLTVRAMLEHMH